MDVLLFVCRRVVPEVCDPGHWGQPLFNAAHVPGKGDPELRVMPLKFRT
jgi:hypothetical protein